MLKQKDCVTHTPEEIVLAQVDKVKNPRRVGLDYEVPRKIAIRFIRTNRFRASTLRVSRFLLGFYLQNPCGFSQSRWGVNLIMSKGVKPPTQKFSPAALVTLGSIFFQYMYIRAFFCPIFGRQPEANCLQNFFWSFFGKFLEFFLRIHIFF